MQTIQRLLFVALLSLWATVASAQTGGTARWTQPEAPATANLYVYMLKNSNAAQAITVTATCTASGSSSSCTAPVPASYINPGSYTLTVACGTASGCLGSTTSDPFVVGSPAKPGTFTITVP